jgi:mycofactocin precursor
METETAVIEASDDTVEIDEEMLVEEISIDGMCGVY